jgi:hypothetical protein
VVRGSGECVRVPQATLDELQMLVTNARVRGLAKGFTDTMRFNVCKAIVGDICPGNPSSVLFNLLVDVDPSGDNGQLPLPALAFAWIGIGTVALGCCGCLFWRWWKNRKLQIRTRTNMAAGVNASKYLHSL